jgi:nitrate/TMAO reductase-like tetraheme cytochrome c subunit
MSSNSSASAVRRLLGAILALALTAGTLFLGAPRKAEALPSESCFCSYYSDSTYTTQVGEYDVYCNGQHTSWGVRTQYVDCACDPC